MSKKSRKSMPTRPSEDARAQVLVLTRSKPRNPLLVPSLGRRAGAHETTRKAMRQQTRQRTQQLLDALLRGDKTEFDVD